MTAALISDILAAHDTALHGFFARHHSDLRQLAQLIAARFEAGNKLLFCGNGGSAGDCLHAAAEFVGRFEAERRPLPAVALPADAAIMTAIANDYGYEHVFARQVAALGRQGDLLIALSTSGSSANILAALAAARARGLTTVLLTGAGGVDGHADTVLAVPDHTTARIQEVHITALHVLTAMVERALGVEGG